MTIGIKVIEEKRPEIISLVGKILSNSIAHGWDCSLTACSFYSRVNIFLCVNCKVKQL